MYVCSLSFFPFILSKALWQILHLQQITASLLTKCSFIYLLQPLISIFTFELPLDLTPTLQNQHVLSLKHSKNFTEHAGAISIYFFASEQISIILLKFCVPVSFMSVYPSEQTGQPNMGCDGTQHQKGRLSFFTTCSCNAVHCISYSNSVRLSVTCRYCLKKNEHRMMSSSQMGSTMIVVFGNIRFIIGIFARDHP